MIGSGKSTLCRYLEREHGFIWIDADKVVHGLYEKGQPGYGRIKNYFGTQFVGPRAVYRGRLRRTVLQNHHKLWILNELIHPLVMNEVSKKLVQLEGVGKSKKVCGVCIEAAYFKEKDLGKFIDRLIVVDAPNAVIKKRLLGAGAAGAGHGRKIPLAQLEKLLKFQRKNLPKWGEVINNKSTERSFYKTSVAALGVGSLGVG